MFTSRMEAHTAERFDSEVPVWWERHAGPLLALALGITAASSASTAAFLSPLWLRAYGVRTTKKRICFKIQRFLALEKRGGASTVDH